MSPTSRKASEVDPQPSAAHALEILEAPARAQHAAEAAKEAAVVADAQHKLVEAVAARLAVLIRIETDLTGWFDRRPKMVPAELEEVHVRNLDVIDRVVGRGTHLLERVTVGQSAARRVGAALERPLADLAACRAQAEVVAAELDQQEPGLVAAHARWLELRALAGTPLHKTAAVNSAQARWMMGDKGLSHD